MDSHVVDNPHQMAIATLENQIRRSNNLLYRVLPAVLIVLPGYDTQKLPELIQTLSVLSPKLLEPWYWLLQALRFE